MGFWFANVRMASGERIPVLVRVDAGIPLWSPTIFMVTELRPTGLASATFLQATRAVMVAQQAGRPGNRHPYRDGRQNRRKYHVVIPVPATCVD